MLRMDADAEYQRRRCMDSNEKAATWDSYTAKLSRRNLTGKERFKLWFYTLFYHHSFSYEYVIDTIMEPIFWFVDHFTHLLGPAFVTAVVVLVGSIVLIAHFVGLPFWLDKSPAFTTFLIVLGYWILTNLVFNFYQVATVSPGLPTDAEKLAKCSVTICKKCITPKPPRTHHCSICNKCYLNMDHHCPWVNNCIGHFNRRYFFLCMVYIVFGCCFVMLFGVELAFREVVMDENILPDCSGRSFILGDDGASMDEVQAVDVVDGIGMNDDDQYVRGKTDDEIKAEGRNDGCDENLVVLYLELKITRRHFRFLLYFAGLLCIGTSLALGGLSLWHAKLITKGETSIEYHSNQSERKKVGKTFVNIYDLGKIRNWEVFLGLDQPNVSFKRNILLPSSHRPTGDGYDWSHVTQNSFAQHLASKF